MQVSQFKHWKQSFVNREMKSLGFIRTVLYHLYNIRYLIVPDLLNQHPCNHIKIRSHKQ